MLIEIHTKTSMSSIESITIRWAAIDKTVPYFTIYHLSFYSGNGTAINSSTSESSNPISFKYASGSYRYLNSYSGIDI
jgi:hypothetical protein